MFDICHTISIPVFLTNNHDYIFMTILQNSFILKEAVFVLLFSILYVK